MSHIIFIVLLQCCHLNAKHAPTDLCGAELYNTIDDIKLHALQQPDRYSGATVLNYKTGQRYQIGIKSNFLLMPMEHDQ